MPKDDRLYLGHMLDAARRVVAKTSGIDREAFDQDEDRRLAVVHLLQTLGEAARRVSTDQRRAYPEIPWQDIVAMRHKIVHDYFQVDENIVWNVATAELPSLVPVLARLVPHEPDAP
jgi:uncharacterized protein with HEPN domain